MMPRQIEIGRPLLIGAEWQQAHVQLRLYAQRVNEETEVRRGQPGTRRGLFALFGLLFGNGVGHFAHGFSLQPATFGFAPRTARKYRPEIRTSGRHYGRLRAPGGCPWDREQTFDSIKPYTLEETYEVLDAMDRREWGELAEELGDFMLQAVFTPRWRRSKALRYRPTRSMRSTESWSGAIRMFSARIAQTGAKSSALGQIKAEEKEGKGRKRRRAFSTTCRVRCRRWWKPSRSLPAPRARASTGQISRTFLQARRRARGIRRSRRAASQDEIENEMGDLLFVLVNLARFVKVDPEQALRRTNAKFRQRFRPCGAPPARQGKQVTERCRRTGSALARRPR